MSISRNTLHLLLAALVLPAPAVAQHIISPHASYVDVAARQATLRSITDPLLQRAVHGLRSCVGMPLVPAPAAPVEIPHHYLSGSSGPTNPAEKAATEVYSDFEQRITAGMNQYVAKGDHAESACALAQLDAWAQGHALLDYDPKDSSQAWYQVEWTLSAAGTTESVIMNDTALDASQQKRVTDWLDTAARKLISFEKPGKEGNNHHYWRALAATSKGVIASDKMLFDFGIDTCKEAIGQIDTNGAFPLEMARHENASHYQGFALQPLIVIAEFAERQGVDLYAYKAHGQALRDAIVFYGRIMADPSIVKQYTSDEQRGNFGGSDFAPFAFYVARFGEGGVPPSILDGLKQPTTSTRIGGSTTILAGK